MEKSDEKPSINKYKLKSPNNACSQVSRQDQLDYHPGAKKSAGVTPEVNLSILLHAYDEAHKQSNPTGLQKSE